MTADMRRQSRWAVLLGAALLALLDPCAPRAGAQTGPTLVIEARAVGGGGTFTFVVTCETPITGSDGVQTSSQTVEQPQLAVAEGATGTLTLSPPDGSACTVLERNAGGGVLSTTSGGAHVSDASGAPLGESVAIHAGATATVTFTNTFVVVQDARAERPQPGDLPRTGGDPVGLAIVGSGCLLIGIGAVTKARRPPRGTAQ